MPGTSVSASEDGAVRVNVKAAAAAESVPPSCCGLAVSLTPMDQLLADLRAAFDAEKALGFTIDNQQDPASFKRLNERVQDLLKAYADRRGADWHKYALFNDLHYVRNLVESNDDFELIVLCWKGGQVSRVHNHADSHCWLAVLDGQMREIQYQRAEPPSGEQQAPEGGAVYVEATETTDMKVGDVGYISDLLALHSVGCYTTHEELDAASACRGGASNGCRGGPGAEADGWRLEGGVTLHLYSPPIRRVKIYEDNAVTERMPGFYSKGGVRV